MPKKDLCRLSECDVEDLDTLAAYRRLRKKWIEMLGGDDVHSISYQVVALFRWHTLYQTIFEARRLNIEDGHPICADLHEFIDVGFIYHQAIGIRKLTEDSISGKGRSVYSLTRILDEMLENISVLTRENYVCYNGLRFDRPVSGHSDVRAGQMHSAFDALSGVAVNGRNRNDRVKSSVINNVKKELRRCDNVSRYANKFLAHAADPENRKSVEGFTLQDLWECYLILGSATNFVSTKLLFGTQYGFRIHGGSPLYCIEAPFIGKDKLNKLREFFEEKQEEIESCSELTSYEKFLD